MSSSGRSRAYPAAANPTTNNKQPLVIHTVKIRAIPCGELLARRVLCCFFGMSPPSNEQENGTCPRLSSARHDYKSRIASALGTSSSTLAAAAKCENAHCTHKLNTLVECKFGWHLPWSWSCFLMIKMKSFHALNMLKAYCSLHQIIFGLSKTKFSPEKGFSFSI